MLLTSISILVYSLGLVLALSMTYIEGQRKHSGWDAFRILGLALCFVWPAVLVCVIATISLSSLSRRTYKFSGVTIKAGKSLPLR